jgi:hypothetical protein
MKVLILPEVRQYLNELSHILYEKDYFSYAESAEKYVEELFEEIKTTLPNRQKRLAPSYFDKYGRNMHYSIFSKNKHTQWYVFFTVYESQGELVHVVRYISNNHVSAQYLRRSSDHS